MHLTQPRSTRPELPRQLKDASAVRLSMSLSADLRGGPKEALMYFSLNYRILFRKRPVVLIASMSTSILSANLFRQLLDMLNSISGGISFSADLCTAPEVARVSYGSNGFGSLRRYATTAKIHQPTVFWHHFLIVHLIQNYYYLSNHHLHQYSY